MIVPFQNQKSVFLVRNSKTGTIDHDPKPTPNIAQRLKISDLPEPDPSKIKNRCSLFVNQKKKSRRQTKT